MISLGILIWSDNIYISWTHDAGTGNLRIDIGRENSERWSNYLHARWHQAFTAELVSILINSINSLL